MMKFVKKQETIEAVKYESGMEDGFIDMAGEGVPYIDTTHGFQNIVEDFDYIVTHSDGHRQCVPAEVFESMYEELPEITWDTHISITHALWVILLLSALEWVVSWIITMWIMTPI